MMTHDMMNIGHAEPDEVDAGIRLDELDEVMLHRRRRGLRRLARARCWSPSPLPSSHADRRELAP